MPRKADSQLNKILVLQTAFIGDVILATGLVRTLSQELPSVQLHFLTIPASREILENSPYLGKILVYDKRGEHSGIFNLIKYSWRLRKENYDVALVPHRSLRSALLVYLAGIRRRIGFDRSAGSLLYTDKVQYSYQIHEIERNLKLVQKLLKKDPIVQLPRIFSSDKDIRIIDEWFQVRNIGTENPLVCLAPGSVWPTKRWPESYWKQLAKMLLESGVKIILIGGPGDKNLAGAIIEAECEGIYSGMGDFTIRQSAEIIRRASLLITNDSAPTHMGIAVETPVLTIYGSTTPQFGFYPYGERNRVLEIQDLECRPCTDHGKKVCPEGHFKCMLNLNPATIFRAAREMIDANL